MQLIHLRPCKFKWRSSTRSEASWRICALWREFFQLRSLPINLEIFYCSYRNILMSHMEIAKEQILLYILMKIWKIDTSLKVTETAFKILRWVG